MKVLYLCSDASIDLTGQKGASIHIRSLVRALADLGHEVTVLCTQVSSSTSIEAELHAKVRPVPLTAWNHRLRRAIRTASVFWADRLATCRTKFGLCTICAFLRR